MMTVGELLETLQELPPETQVILQKDSEGNGYSPLSCSGMGFYVPESTWSGYVYDIDWSPSDCCMEESEWSEMRKAPQSIILVPVN